MNFLWSSIPLIPIAFTLLRFRRMGINKASSTNLSDEDACEPVRGNEPWISSSLFKLYEPSPSDLTNMDLFFFHGLQSEGNSDVHLSTWRSGNASQEVWPQSWLPTKYPRARILSVSYDGAIRTTGKEGMMDLHVIGENLLQEILGARQKQWNKYPVILVGHSFGGLVIKQLCLQAYKNKDKATYGHDTSRFLDRIKGIFFYATPHRGMNGTFWDDLVKSNMARNEPLLNFVKGLSLPATRLHEDFDEKRRDYKWQIYGIGESHAVAGQDTPLVPEASARYGDNYMTAECDHFSVCRPVNKSCNTYTHLVHLVDTIYEENQDGEKSPQRVGKVIMGVESLLIEAQQQLESHAFLGLSGMGGIGKTTLAKLVFNTVCGTFEYSCFIDDFKLIQGDKEEIKKKIWIKMHHHSVSVVESSETRADMWRRLRGKKLLVVFDDIDQDKHIELLEEIADDNALQESRFITTSRDEGVLRRLNGIHICQVPTLEPKVARELLISYAFPERRKPPEHLKDILEEVVEGCDGLPLTLEVLGKYLRGEKEEKVWIEIPIWLKKADEIPSLETRVWSKLQISYNTLGDAEQNMFMDVASFLLLEGCRFSFDDLVSAWSSRYECAHNGWKTLLDRSLVQEVTQKYTESKKEDMRLVIDCTNQLPGMEYYEEYGEYGNSIRTVHMHEHLRRMGQRIARESGRSCDISDLLGGINMRPIRLGNAVALCATMNARGIDCSNADPDENIGEIECSDGKPCYHDKVQKILRQLTSISYLELLIFHGILRRYSMSCDRCSTTGGLSLPGGLVMLDCAEYTTNLKLPLEGSVCRELAVLKLGGLWKMHTSGSFVRDIFSPQSCRHLLKLKRLILRENVIHIPHEFGELRQLQHLEIESGSLEGLPESFGSLSRLEYVKLRCESLSSLPSTFGKLAKLQRLVLDKTSVQRLPDNFGDLSRLEHLEICSDQLIRLPDSTGKLSRLKFFKLKDGYHQILPKTFGTMSNLERLELWNCKELERLPETFGNLDKLKHLGIRDCTRFEGVPATFGNLSSLERLVLWDCEELKRFPETFGNLGSLKHLDIGGCTKFEGVPATFGNLRSLEHLELFKCQELERLPEIFGNLSSLKDLEIRDCTKFEGVPATFGNLSSLEHLKLWYCKELEGLPLTFGNLGNLKHLEIRSCTKFEGLPETFNHLSCLEHLVIVDCPQLQEPPETLRNMSRLTDVQIY